MNGKMSFSLKRKFSFDVFFCLYRICDHNSLMNGKMSFGSLQCAWLSDSLCVCFRRDEETLGLAFSSTIIWVFTTGSVFPLHFGK
jgi:hypothetical protein